MKTQKFTATLLLMLLLGLLFTSQSVMGQAPANDHPTNPANLVLGNPISGTTIGATVDNVAYCQASVTGPGVWYLLEGDGGTCKLSTCSGTNFDTKLSVYTGTPGAMTCIAGNDDNPNCQYFAAELDLVTQAGEDYYVMVHGFGTTSGNFTLSASPVAITASNATCATAEKLTAGVVSSGSTAGGELTTYAPSINGISITSPTVWYEFQGNGGPAILETCSSNSNFDTRISVYTGVCGSLAGQTANDDYCNSLSRVELNTTINNATYYVAVHGFGSQTGDFDLNFEQPTPPVNDQPCGALPLTINTPTGFDNTHAFSDVNEVNPGAGTGASTCNSNDGWCFFEKEVQNSIYYTFVAPNSGCVSVLAEGFDVQIAIYSVTDCNDYTTFGEIAANDDSGILLNPGLPPSGPAGLVEVPCLTPGATYYLQIDGFNGAEGQGTVTVMDCGNAPLTVDAGNCQSLFDGYAPAEGDTAFLTATATGGFAPYVIEWAEDPSILYENSNYQGIAVQPTTTTIYTVTVTDAKGCTATDQIIVEREDLNTQTFAPQAGDFRTQTQGGWGTGATGTNPGVYRDAHFKLAFPNGLTVGGNYTAQFTSSQAIEDFLPSGSTPDVLTQDYLNPPGNGRDAHRNVFTGQLVALGLSLGFDAYDPNYSASSTPLKDLIIASGDFAGMTVQQVYDEANIALGRGTTPHTYSELNSAIASINQNFVDGTTAGTFLLAPGVTMCNGTLETSVASSAVSSLLAQGYRLGSCSNSCIGSNPSFPAPAPCESLVITFNGDFFSEIENTWSLTDLTSGVVLQAPTAIRAVTPDTFTFCVDPTHCYDLDIQDIFGDGFFYGGNYSVTYMGQTITSNFVDPSYGPMFSENQTIGTCSSQKRAEVEMDNVELTGYPNPFRTEATIEFRLPEADHVTLEVYSMTGQRVATLFNGNVPANVQQSVKFNGSNLNSGFYIYKLRSDSGLSKEGKLVLQK